MDAAWELGITTFDTADAYGGGRSETMVGKWIGEPRRQPGSDHQDVQPDGGRSTTAGSRARGSARQLESSLERLGVDRVDVYLAHEFDPDVPANELVGTFEGLASASA